MKKFKVKICNEHFKRLGSGNRPRHSLIITANDIKMWADWKIYDVVKA